MRSRVLIVAGLAFAWLLPGEPVRSGDDPLAPPFMALRRFFTAASTLKAEYRVHHVIHHNDSLTWDEKCEIRVALRKRPGGLVRERIENGKPVVTQYWDGGTLSWHWNRDKNLAVSQKGVSLSTLGLNLKTWSQPGDPFLPNGLDLYEYFFITDNLDGTLTALRKISRLAGEEEIDGARFWVIEAEHLAGDGVPREGKRYETFTSRKAVKIWIGQADGAPRRCAFEERAAHGSWSIHNDLVTDYVDIRTGVDIPTPAFEYTPSGGVRKETAEDRDKAFRDPRLRLPAVGAPAPDFEAAGPDGKILRLSDLKGKIVIVSIGALT